MQAPDSLRGALLSPPFIVTTHHIYAFRQWFRSCQQAVLYSQSAGLGLRWVRVGMVILAKFDNHRDTVVII
jgi:hypothetical protein